MGRGGGVIQYIIAGLIALGLFFVFRNIEVDFETAVVVLLLLILVALWDLKRN